MASLVANIGIVVTGGAVRLTARGWAARPGRGARTASLVPHGELGVHGVIEFGNRMLTLVLAAVAIATWVAVLRLPAGRRSLRGLATVLALGVPAQALLGGVTVLTDLNPWVVPATCCVSLPIIAVAVLLVRRVDERTAAGADGAAPGALLVQATYGDVWLVLYVGTVVTGSGPHAGDADSPRNGLDPATVSQVHADLVFLLRRLTVGDAARLRACGATAERAARRWLAAGGRAGAGRHRLRLQYFTDLPVVLVGLHVLGAALLDGSGTWAVLTIYDRGSSSQPDPPPTKWPTP